jgi:hypothetical protein
MLFDDLAGNISQALCLGENASAESAEETNTEADTGTDTDTSTESADSAEEEVGARRVTDIPAPAQEDTDSAALTERLQSLAVPIALAVSALFLVAGRCRLIPG